MHMHCQDRVETHVSQQEVRGLWDLTLRGLGN